MDFWVLSRELDQCRSYCERNDLIEARDSYGASPVERAQKVEMVANLKEIFQDAGVVVVTHYSGLSVGDMGDLRGKLREADARLKVIKNRLAKLALEGTEMEGVSPLLKGPVAIVYAKDPVGASKVAVDYAKDNENFIVLGGLLGASVLDADGITALSKMPSLDELRASLVGVLNAPGGKFVRTLNAPAGGFVTALDGAGHGLVNALRAKAAQGEAA